MRRATALRVTVKHRIGIDGLERYEDMERFVRVAAGAGCERFIVHARIAVLQGLSPKENRTVPPLRYDDVYRLKAAYPQLHVAINGGITTLDQAAEHLEAVDSVMIGRAAYDQPFLFAPADTLFFGAPHAPPSRRQVLEAMLPYLEKWTALRPAAAPHYPPPAGPVRPPTRGAGLAPPAQCAGPDGRHRHHGSADRPERPARQGPRRPAAAAQPSPPNAIASSTSMIGMSSRIG